MESKNTKQDIQFMREACWEGDKTNCTHPTGGLAVKDKEIRVRGHNVLFEYVQEMYPENSEERILAQHSEINLISNAARDGISLKGAEIYLTRFPCVECSKALVACQVKKIFYKDNLYVQGNTSYEFLTKSGIEVIQIPDEEVWRGYSYE